MSDVPEGGEDLVAVVPEQDLEAANADLEAKLAEALKERADAIARTVELEAQVEELSPTADVSHFLMETPDDVRARFSDQQLKDLANEERIRENRERNARGDFPLPALEGAELEASIDRAIGLLLADREAARPPLVGPLDRVLKMVDRQGQLRQIPYEPQVNNMAGSLADGYERYRQKGFKMTKPTLCPTKDCYNAAAIAADGEYAYGAYCSTDHQARTERANTQTNVPGVTNRNVMRGMTPG